MHIRKPSVDGFAHFLLLFIAVVLAAVGFVGYPVFGKVRTAYRPFLKVTRQKV